MNYKIKFLVLILSSFLAVSAYARKPEPPPKPVTADDIVAKMKIQLQLSDQQAEQVKPIIENYLAEQEQAKQEEKKRLSKVLTGDQMFTWNFLQNEPPKDKKKHSGL